MEDAGFALLVIKHNMVSGFVKVVVNEGLIEGLAVCSYVIIYMQDVVIMNYQLFLYVILYFLFLI